MKINMKVAVFSAKPFEKESLQKSNKDNKHELIYFNEMLGMDTLHLCTGFEAVSVFSNDDLSAKVLVELNKIGVKYISLRSAGYDHVDLEKAHQLQIKLAYVPDYSPYSVAEHSIALMMALNRKLIVADKRIREYNFELNPLIGFDMNGKTVGIIGTGKIGAVACKILHGFGCKILAFDLLKNDDLISKYNVEYVSLDTLYAHSDIISLYCPFNEKTKYLINKESIAKMKNGVMIINTARGAILNTVDAIEGIANGKIGSLGLDVYENEKGLFFYDFSNEKGLFFYDFSNEKGKDKLLNSLLAFENVLITGHQAFLTDIALENRADATIYNISCFEQNIVSKNSL
jgi:D-lactate dehydrogenase